MTDTAAVTSFEKANTAYEEGQKAFKENPTPENSLKNYNDIKNRNTMDAVRGARHDHGYTNPSKDYSAGNVSTGFSGGQAVMPGTYPKMPTGASDGEGFTSEQIQANRKKAVAQQNDVRKQMKEKQESVVKPKSKVDMGKVALGANTALSALSGLTGFASKMGDASRKLVQTVLNPSPTGLNEVNGFMDTTQQGFDAARTGIKGIDDTQKQFKNDKKLLKERDEFRDYNELEKIRNKYVDLMDKTPNDEDWGDIAKQYQNEIVKYFTDSGRDMTKLDPNSIQAKQMKRTARELTNMAQRKKSKIGIENAKEVHEAKKEKFEAKNKLDNEKSILKDINIHDKAQVADMLKVGKDRNGNDLSDDDKITLGLLLEINDFDTAAGMGAGGEGISSGVYKRLAKAANERISKTVDPAEKQRLENMWKTYQKRAADAKIEEDNREYELNESVYSNPDTGLVEKLKYMNRGKQRGYDLNDVKTLNEVGFIPNKNLIKDARYILDKNGRDYQNKIDEMEKIPGHENSPEYRRYKKALQSIEYERAKMTPAFLLADAHANMAEKLERTVPSEDFKMVPRYIRGKDGQDMTGEQWFEAVRQHTPVVELTDENLKAATYDKIYKMAMTANTRLQKAWQDYEKRAETDPDAKFEGLNTLILGDDGNPVIDDISGKPKTIGSEMVRDISGTIRDYDTSLNLIHPQGSETAPNMKEVLYGIGQTLTDYIHNNGGQVPPLTPPSKATPSFDFGQLKDSGGNPVSEILDIDETVPFQNALSKMKNPNDRTRMSVAKMYHGLLNSKTFSKATKEADLSRYKVIEEYIEGKHVPRSKLKTALKDLVGKVENYDARYGGNYSIKETLSPASKAMFLKTRSWIGM